MCFIIVLFTTDETHLHSQCILTSWSIIIMSLRFHFCHAVTACFFIVLFLRQEVSLQSHDSSLFSKLVYFFHFCDRCWNLFVSSLLQKRNNCFLIISDIFPSYSLLYHLILNFRFLVRFNGLVNHMIYFFIFVNSFVFWVEITFSSSAYLLILNSCPLGSLILSIFFAFFSSAYRLSIFTLTL